MADLSLSASPSSGGKKPKMPAPRVPTVRIPKLCMSPTGDHSLVSRMAGATVGVVSTVALVPTTFLSNPSAPTTQSTGTGTGTTASSMTPTGHTTYVSVGVEGIAFTPNHVEVPVGDCLVIDFTNSGDQRHDLVFEVGVSSGSLMSGETEELDLGIVSGDVEDWCSLPGHREFGMTLHVQVTGASSSSSSSSGTLASDSHVHHGHDHGQNAAAGPITPTALMGCTEIIDARDPMLSSTTNETEHHYTLTITEQTVSMASSLTCESWTFSGDVPGPILCGHIGGAFHTTLINSGAMNHSLDFRVGLAAPDNVMHSIESGQTLEYAFVAKNAGIWLYHCSTAPMSMHIASSMLGAVIIDPIDLNKVDREYVMVASELYLGTDGRPTDISLLSTLQLNAMAFNSVPFQHRVHPIQTKTNERVCVWAMDAGPNLAAAFHVVGTQFDTVWREGVCVIRGGGSDGDWGQILTLGAVEGGFVEFTPLETGRYTFVNRTLPLTGEGQVGVFEVTD